MSDIGDEMRRQEENAMLQRAGGLMHDGVLQLIVVIGVPAGYVCTLLSAVLASLALLTKTPLEAVVEELRAAHASMEAAKVVEEAGGVLEVGGVPSEEGGN